MDVLDNIWSFKFPNYGYVGNSPCYFKYDTTYTIYTSENGNSEHSWMNFDQDSLEQPVLTFRDFDSQNLNDKVDRTIWFTAITDSGTELVK